MQTQTPADPQLLSLDRAREEIKALFSNVESVFLGKTEAVQLVVTALVARGHVLLEDVPGVGKTTLAQAMARSLGAQFQRIQFTSDLLPSDILGITLFNREENSFEFRPGPIFTNVLLADEINRTSPRTQSALLEAMGESRISLDDRTHQLPDPFIVLATQNPLEYHGTYPLPESQLDRFLIRLSIGYPSEEVERTLLLQRKTSEPVESLREVLSLEDLLWIQAMVDQVIMDESLAEHILKVVNATRTSPLLRAGVSTRGALALARAARAHALVCGRTYCIPDDLTQLFVPVLAHRISLGGMSDSIQSTRAESESIIEEIVSNTDAPV